mgnify:CR=1 FL=1
MKGIGHSLGGLEVEAALSAEEVRVLAFEALKRRLFLPQGQLQFTLKNVVTHPESYALAGVWKEGVLHGIGLVEKEANRCQAYVSMEVRMRGAGRHVMAAALAVSGCSAGRLHAHAGEPFVASLQFWRALGVPVWSEAQGVKHLPEGLLAAKESYNVAVPLRELLTKKALAGVLLALPELPRWMASEGVAGRFTALMAVAEGSHAGSIDFDVHNESVVFRCVSGSLRVALGVFSAEDGRLRVGEFFQLVKPVRGWEPTLLDALKAWDTRVAPVVAFPVRQRFKFSLISRR